MRSSRGLVSNKGLAPNRKAKEKAEIRETENLAWMEQSIDYDVIPIRNLVKVQLESGLLYAQYIKQIQH